VRRITLPLILIVYLMLAAAMSFIVPLGEAPDEIDHFLYVRYLLEHRTFPVLAPTAANNKTMEANQPPLFYLLNAAVTAPFPTTASADLPLNACFTFDPHDGGRAHFYLHRPAEQNLLSSDYLAFRAARLVSVLMGSIAVWLAYQLGQQMVPGDERVALLAAAFLAFNPQFVFMSASVNNDVLTAVLGAALVYASVQAATQPTLSRFVVLGVLMGLALLTKFALLAFWPLALLSVVIAALHKPYSVFQNLFLVLALPLFIAGWWYARAVQLYGDPLAWEVHLQAKGSEVLRAAPLALADLREFVLIHFQSYWAWFGWLKIQAPGWVYGLLLVLVLVAVVGLVWVIREWRVEISHSPLSNRPVSPTAVLFNLLATAAIYLSLLRYIQTINWSGYQGRLAFAAAASLAALLGLGWWRVGRKLRHGRSVGLMALPMVGLGLLATGSLLFLIRPAFPRPEVYQPAVDVPRQCVRVAGLEVEALAPVEGRPGAGLLVEPWLYGLETAVSQPFQVQVVGRGGQIVGQATADLSWAAGELWQPSWHVAIDAAAEPVRGVLRLGPPGALQDVAAVVIRPERPFIPQPQYSLQADFAGRIRLTGYDWQEGRITLYWQALASLNADYTTFVHVLDAQGGLVAQADGQPQAGAYPTSVWSVGEFVPDEKEVPWPVAGKQPLRVVVGIYVLETGERLLPANAADVVTLFTLE
jgi:hypothetical protein